MSRRQRRRIWHDMSEKVERAAHVDGPAFLNVLTDCPVGWGHEPRLSPAIVDAAVDSCFWPLYEVVDGRFRLTYLPPKIVPVEEWLRPQQRFRHLFQPENLHLLSVIQRQVDEEWTALVGLCGADASVNGNGS
jgi:pyruvate ferredoxin oxidoreductase beta subunit